eukprot:m.245337 g.245337  ORF g.245337 m.245337 type:complete len:909 (-) comp26401_c0_seq1:139-2865(-)
MSIRTPKAPFRVQKEPEQVWEYTGLPLHRTFSSTLRVEQAEAKMAQLQIFREIVADWLTAFEPDQKPIAQPEIMEYLQNGVLLCRVAQTVFPTHKKISVHTVSRPVSQASPMSDPASSDNESPVRMSKFRSKANVEQFLVCCDDEGVPPITKFEAIDLVEGNSEFEVLNHLISVILHQKTVAVPASLRHCPDVEKLLRTPTSDHPALSPTARAEISNALALNNVEDVEPTSKGQYDLGAGPVFIRSLAPLGADTSTEESGDREVRVRLSATVWVPLEQYVAEVLQLSPQQSRKSSIASRKSSIATPLETPWEGDLEGAPPSEVHDEEAPDGSTMLRESRTELNNTIELLHELEGRSPDELNLGELPEIDTSLDDSTDSVAALRLCQLTDNADVEEVQPESAPDTDGSTYDDIEPPAHRFTSGASGVVDEDPPDPADSALLDPHEPFEDQPATHNHSEAEDDSQQAAVAANAEAIPLTAVLDTTVTATEEGDVSETVSSTQNPALVIQQVPRIAVEDHTLKSGAASSGLAAYTASVEKVEDTEDTAVQNTQPVAPIQPQRLGPGVTALLANSDASDDRNITESNTLHDQAAQYYANTMGEPREPRRKPTPTTAILTTTVAASEDDRNIAESHALHDQAALYYVNTMGEPREPQRKPTLTDRVGSAIVETATSHNSAVSWSPDKLIESRSMVGVSRHGTSPDSFPSSPPPDDRGSPTAWDRQQPIVDEWQFGLSSPPTLSAMLERNSADGTATTEYDELWQDAQHIDDSIAGLGHSIEEIPIPEGADASTPRRRRPTVPAVTCPSEDLNAEADVIMDTLKDRLRQLQDACRIGDPPTIPVASPVDERPPRNPVRRTRRVRVVERVSVTRRFISAAEFGLPPREPTPWTPWTKPGPNIESRTRTSYRHVCV